MINEEIKAVEVRLVDEEKGSYIIKTSEALKMAEEAELDLICISQNGEMPVVKIGDYSKYCYEQKKKAKDNAKKAKMNSQDTKEIQITENTADNDLKTKAKHIDRFLTNNDKVRLSIKYKGRSIRNINGGHVKLSNLMAYITVGYKVDKPSTIEGNTVSVILSPDR